MSDKCSICKTGIRGNHYLYFVGKEILIMHYRCSRKLFFAMKQQRTDGEESEKIEAKLNIGRWKCENSKIKNTKT